MCLEISVRSFKIELENRAGLAPPPHTYTRDEDDEDDDDDDDDSDDYDNVAMELEGISETNEVMLPRLPPLADALPIVAADPALERPLMPGPRDRERRRRSQGSLLVELLSRRMSRQTLLQQNQCRASQPPLVPRPASPPMDSCSHPRPPLAETDSALDGVLCASGDVTMEIDLDETLGDGLPLPTPPSARRTRPPRSYLPLLRVSPVIPGTKIDPDVAFRVLARMQADTQAASGAALAPARSSSPPAIEIDPAEQADVDLEADEGYGEGSDEYLWLGDKSPAGLAGALRDQGLLSFTTSAEAALRCPKLVRNVPRMRKRTDKKKKHRLRNLRETAGDL
ncbi:hypothetical protein Trco_002940 [Trichoderma cornu-damae]|uniref:Uncharacterized protein n=1 Tax=Trichoderma cornu-damae TaxID=654480 RepID=A0A9P8TZL2_9HYPO|nr:hypothetical protein Trco_002940 [Trichoderma cornu-damae]